MRWLSGLLFRDLLSEEGKFRQELLEEISEHCGPSRELLAVVPSVDETTWETDALGALEQRMADLYPMRAREGFEFQCSHCGGRVERAFGCVLCLRVACTECARRERHRHWSEEDWTLASIAPVLGVKPSAAAMQVARILRKLRGLAHKQGWVREGH